MLRRLYLILLLLASALAVLLGLWFRVSSLGWMAPIDGDEAFYGTQAARLAQGRSFSWTTSSGNLLDPFFPIIQAPVLAVLEPSPWILRLPSALAGILMVGLAFPLLRRRLDRPTALLAAIALAVLPAAIVFNRIGCEFGQTPLFSLLALAAALSGNPRTLLAASAPLLLVHPTNLFLFPTLLSAYFGRLWVHQRPSSLLSRPVIVPVLGLGLLGAAMAGWVLLGRTTGSTYLRTWHEGLDWSRFLSSVPAFLWAQPYFLFPLSHRQFPARSWFLGALVLLLILLGTAGLIRRRAWDRLAILAGFALSLSAFHLVAGSGVLLGPVNRYGSFLLAPAAVVLAILARDLLFHASNPDLPRVRLFPATLALALAFLALADLKARRFDFFRDRDGESLWTFHVDARDPWVQAYRLLASDTRTDQLLVLAQDWWTHRPLEYLDARARRLRLVPFDDLTARIGPDAARHLLHNRLESGAQAVGFHNQTLAAQVRNVVPPGRLLERVQPLGGVPYVVILGLSPSEPNQVASTAHAPLR